jgi:hypothetical protein
VTVAANERNHDRLRSGDDLLRRRDGTSSARSRAGLEVYGERAGQAEHESDDECAHRSPREFWVAAEKPAPEHISGEPSFEA